MKRNVINGKIFFEYSQLRDKEIVLRALSIFRSSKLDFVDALLCAYGRELPIISFYKALNKCVEDIHGDSP